jgi:hypothetical protein
MMSIPRPASLRLETRARTGKVPPPPFGLPAWSDEAPAIAVVLDASACDLESAAEVAAQLPDPSTLEPGTRVFVMGAASRGAGLLRRLMGSVTVPRVSRCTALLARGYVGIGAGVDEVSRTDVVWGSVP